MDVDFNDLPIADLRQAQVIDTSHDDGVLATEFSVDDTARLAGVGMEDAFVSGAVLIVYGDWIAIVLINDKESTSREDAFTYCAANLGGHC